MPLLPINGTTLFVDETGPADAPAVIFSNSLGTTVEMWDQQVRSLARSWRCVRYDTRGHGRSPAGEGPVTLDLLVGDLAGIIAELGLERPVVVGLSLGGITAQAYAVAHPDGLSALVLMATAPHLPPRENWLARAATVEDAGMAAIVDAVMPRWFTPAFAKAEPGLLAVQRERFLANDPAGYAACCRALADVDLRAAVSAIRVPTLVVAGQEDPVTTVAMAEALARDIAGARVEVIPDVSHILTVERPREATSVLTEFLSRNAPAPEGARGSSFQAGLANRKAVLGVDDVQRSLANAGPFAMPWQDFITRGAWGEIWGDPALPWKTRSLVTLAMMVALHREEEFKLHVRPALRNGVSLEELRSLLLQTAIYAGVPAANAAFRWARDVLGDALDEVGPPPQA
jgi:3-oxoadipate enol-lactonase / 4-carboxymuconolactone decarboxylase